MEKGHKTGQRTIRARERQAQALRLRKGGATYEMIAKQLGYRGPSGAHRAVTVALRRLIEEPAEELLKLELSRLDALLVALWPRALNGALGAVDRVLRIHELRCKLLGLGQQVAEESYAGRPLVSITEVTIVPPPGLPPGEVVDGQVVDVTPALPGGEEPIASAEEGQREPVADRGR